MSARPFRPFRWVAGGSIALIVTIWTALMLGLHAPAVRSVPVAPWAEGGFGADATETAAAPPARLSPGGAPPLRPARVAGVRIPTTPEPVPAGPPADPPADPIAPVAPVDPGGAPKPTSAPAIPSLPIPPAETPSLPAFAPAEGIGG